MTEQELRRRRANLRLLPRLRMADLQKGALHPEKGRQVTVEELMGMWSFVIPINAGQIERLKQLAKAA